MTIRLQACIECGAVLYPDRQVCRECICDRLIQVEDSGVGELLAIGVVEKSLEPAYAAILPVRIGTVKLDSGPQVICFIETAAMPGDRVRLQPAENPLGEAVWRACLEVN